MEIPHEAMHSRSFETKAQMVQPLGATCRGAGYGNFSRRKQRLERVLAGCRLSENTPSYPHSGC